MRSRATGKGPPVVFVHGAAGSGQNFAAQVQAFRDIHTCHFVDLAGHGPSIEDYAGAVAQFIESLKEPVTLVGHSMGGAIAIEVALRRASLLRGLVLAGTGCRLPVSEKLLQSFETDYEKAIASVTRYCFSKEVDPELLRRAQREIANVPPELVKSDFHHCNAFDRCARIAEIQVPTLVVCGTKDVMTPPPFSEALANAIPGAVLEWIPDGSHMAMSENPAVFNEILRRFLVLH